jgi:hypothetical protein
VAGVLIGKLGEEAARYSDLFDEHIADALRGYGTDNKNECKSASVMCSDLLMALDYEAELATAFCERFIGLVLGALARPELDSSAHPPLLSLIGDMALSTRSAFKVHFARANAVLTQVAARAFPRADNADDVERVAEVRECCIEAYTGVLLGVLDIGGGGVADRDAIVLARDALPAAASLVTATLRDDGGEDDLDPDSEGSRRYFVAVALLLDLVGYFGQDAVDRVGRHVAEDAIQKSQRRSEPGQELYDVAALLRNRLNALDV